MEEATSRVARKPVNVPATVEVAIDGQQVSVKGPNGQDSCTVHDSVDIAHDEGALRLTPCRAGRSENAMAGTMRSMVNNIVMGVTDGFRRNLLVRGVGYRAQMQGSTLRLALGFSHDVEFAVPEDVSVDCPSQSEIVIKGANKQRVGQVAADIRAFRPPEPYKGKGVRYDDETVIIKEAKKK